MGLDSVSSSIIFHLISSYISSCGPPLLLIYFTHACGVEAFSLRVESILWTVKLPLQELLLCIRLFTLVFLFTSVCSIKLKMAFICLGEPMCTLLHLWSFPSIWNGSKSGPTDHVVSKGSSWRFEMVPGLVCPLKRKLIEHFLFKCLSSPGSWCSVFGFVLTSSSTFLVL